MFFFPLFNKLRYELNTNVVFMLLFFFSCHFTDLLLQLWLMEENRHWNIYERKLCEFIDWLILSNCVNCIILAVNTSFHTWLWFYVEAFVLISLFFVVDNILYHESLNAIHTYFIYEKSKFESQTKVHRIWNWHMYLN